SCVHITAGDGTLTFTATDYDVTMTADVAADVMESGAALVNGRALFEVVRALPDGVDVQLSCDTNHRIRIEAGRSYYHLNGLAPSEFPQVLEDASGKSLHLDKDQLSNMLRRTLFSVSHDESRPALNGVLLEIEPDQSNHALIRMVSTDGHRLSKVERAVEASDYDGAEHSCIVHRRGAAELLRIFEGPDQGVRIEFLGRTVVFTSDHARLQVRQIEERFPEYNRVIPEQGDVHITVSKTAFVNAIRRVSSLATGKHNLLRMDLDDGRMALEMVHADFGDAHEELEIPEYQGSQVEVGFNPRYLLDVCNVMETDSITLELRDQFSPCLLQSEDESGSTFVVMPMRL
ncbi:MAG TPA: DNA polymerase III subunit beta, partial [Myxococcales bacterium]|nr:DNA polymerase III subunit beta [Myxococcales bacterium]